MSDYFICPHCGAKVDRDATACPECGSDETTGWSEDTGYDGMWSLVDEAYDAPEQADSGSDIPWTKLIAGGLLFIFLLATAAYNAVFGVSAIILTAGAIAYFYYRQQNKPDSNDTYFLYQSLLSRARGDEALVERLVAYERERNPEASPQELLSNALWRWDHDNRVR